MDVLGAGMLTSSIIVGVSYSWEDLQAGGIGACGTN